MSRWGSYVERMDEKVSKQELDDALKNDNILIGCEFEFQVEEGKLDIGDNEGMELWNGAVAEVERYNKDVIQYNHNLEYYDEETQDMVAERDQLDEKRDELTNAISDAEETRDDLKNEVKTLVSTIKGLEKNKVADPESIKSEIDNAKAEMVVIVDKINKENSIIKEWQDEIDYLTKKITNLDEDIQSREDGRYEDIETPYFSEHTAPEYFDYMINYMGFSKRDLYIEPGEQAGYPPNWDGGSSSDNFVEGIQNSGILDTAPFSHYRVGTYGNFSPEPGDTEWSVEDDESLGENGCEIKNPPMELPGFVNRTLKEMFNWIDQIGTTDSSCGFHCHMSVKNPLHELDYIKLILFTDEEWIYKAFSSRAGSFYATSAKQKLHNKQPLSNSDVKELFNKKDLIMKSNMSSEHFDAIRLLDTKTGHVEFRYMGGEYHNKYDDVRKTIGVYAHNLSLAVDPEYKRKEYILKLQRITNKTELFVLDIKLQILTALQTHGSPEATKTDVVMIDKMIKDTKGYISTLSGSVKLDSKTKDALKTNHGFYSEMLKSIYKNMEGIISKDLIAKGKQYI
jgi:hypothetical protein